MKKESGGTKIGKENLVIIKDGRERRNKHRREYYSKNKDKMGEEKKKYYPSHKEQIKKYVKEWIKENPKKRKAISKKYRLRHTKEIKESDKKYRHTSKGKECYKKGNAKQRRLGFIPLNSYFPGSEGHHIDSNYVIYIPRKLHRSVWHSIILNINMEEINKKAFEFLKNCKEKEREYGTKSR